MAYVTTLVDLVLAQVCFVCLSYGSIVALRFSRRVPNILRPLRCCRLPVNVRESHLVYGGKVFLGSLLLPGKVTLNPSLFRGITVIGVNDALVIAMTAYAELLLRGNGG